MSSNPEIHRAVHLRCFLCDHDLPEIEYSERPAPLVVSLFDYGGIVDVDMCGLELVLGLRHHNTIKVWSPDGYRRFMRKHYVLAVASTDSSESDSDSGSSDDSGSNDGSRSDDDSASMSCGYCEPQKSLFIAHLDCWKVVAGSNGVSTDRLHEFAVQTMPLAPKDAVQLHAHPSMSELAGVVDSGTPLGRLIVDTADRLPEELHRKIMDEVQLHAMSCQRQSELSASAFKALLRCSGVLFTRLATARVSSLPMLKSQLERARGDVAGRDSGRLSTMYIRTVQLFDQAYIREVGFNETADDLPAISLQSGEIRGMRFALGRFGLRGLRILYAGGSVSSWLGSTSGCFYGNVHGGCLRDLEVFTDGPRIVRISLRPTPSPGPGLSYALMDREIHAPHGHLLTFMSKRHRFTPVLSTPHYPETTWTHTSCLPLVFGSTYTSGLTVFFRKGKLTGMASYGPKEEIATVGWCKGEAVHFPLVPGEYFTSLWVRSPCNNESPRAVPPLVAFGTSVGRSAHFGLQRMLRPCLRPPTIRHRWEAISSWAGPSKITGLLVDVLAEWRFGGHRRFGVVQEPLEASNDELALATPTVLEIAANPPGFSNDVFHDEAFRSTGSLYDVAVIQVRRKLNRCVGMRIIHGVGLDDTLGSWEPDDTSSISTIFDSSQEAPLATLLFHVRLRREYFSRIIVGVTTSNSTGSYLEHWGGSELMVIPVEETGSLTRPPLIPGDFLVEFRCGQPNNVIAWYQHERFTQVRSFTPGDYTPVECIFDPEELRVLAWEPRADSIIIS